MPTKLFTLLAFLLLGLAACQKESFQYREGSDLIDDFSYVQRYLFIGMVPPSYHTVLPVHLSRTGLQPQPVSNDKATLGRVLFYDKNLSKDQSVSCASCHHQNRAFADNKAFSTGVFGRQTTRNSMALGAVVNYSSYHSVALNGSGAAGFFWDDRADDVATQSKATLLNSHEMDIEMSEVTQRIKDMPYYPWLFSRAYGDAEVTEDRVLSAISDFVNAMGSYRSLFDNVAAKVSAEALQKPLPGLSAEQNRGWGIYVNFCGGCHGAEVGKPAVLLANNGLDLEYTDQGLGDLTGKPEDKGVFKVPGLRNIALTAPYMHDGRFKTLDEVLLFYSRDVQPHPNLHPKMQEVHEIENTPMNTGGTTGGWGNPTDPTLTPPIKGSLATHLNLSDADIRALKAFLLTLNDEELLRDYRFSDPFQ